MDQLDDRPDLVAMMRWRDMLLADWGNEAGSLDQEQANEEELYFQSFPIQAPYGKLAARTGSAPSDAEAAIDSLSPKDIQVSVRPSRDRKKYKDQAAKLQKAALGVLHAWQKKKDILRLIASDMVIRRVGVGRVMYDDRLWPPYPDELQAPPPQEEGQSDEEYEEVYEGWDDKRVYWERRNKRKWPVILERRNPRHTRWRDLDGEILAVVEHYQTTVLEAFTLWQHWPDCREALRGRDANDLVWIDDIWRGKYRCILVDDQPIMPSDDGIVEHSYPEIPYVIAPFRELGFDEMHRRYRGMLTNADGLYRIEADVLSMNLWLLAWNAWRTYVGWTNGDEDIQIIPGKFIRLDKRKGEYLEMLQGQAVPPELLQMVSVIDAYIQRNGVAQGPRTAEGTRSAQQLWAIQAMRQLKIESARDSLERLVRRSLELAMMIVELVVGEELTLPVPGKNRDGNDMGEVTFGPKDIDSYYDGFRVSFTRRVDPALIEQAKAFMAFAINKWMPQELSVEFSGLTDDVRGWMNMLVDETVEHSPVMAQMYALERTKQTFGEDSEQFQLMQQIVQQTFMAGSTGGAGMMGAAPGQPAGGGGGMTPSSPRGEPSPNGAGDLSSAMAMRPSSRVTGNQGRTPPQFGGGSAKTGGA